VDEIRQDFRSFFWRAHHPCSSPCYYCYHHPAGASTSDAELKEMIQRADADQDGEVSFEDFYTIMTRRSLS
jgi:hypothetical protein